MTHTLHTPHHVHTHTHPTHTTPCAHTHKPQTPNSTHTMCTRTHTHCTHTMCTCTHPPHTAHTPHTPHTHCTHTMCTHTPHTDTTHTVHTQGGKWHHEICYGHTYVGAQLAMVSPIQPTGQCSVTNIEVELTLPGQKPLCRKPLSDRDKGLFDLLSVVPSTMSRTQQIFHIHSHILCICIFFPAGTGGPKLR